MLLCDFSRQAEAKACSFAHRLGGEKGLEDLLAQLEWYGDSAIGYSYEHFSSVLVGDRFDFHPFFGRFLNSVESVI